MSACRWCGGDADAPITAAWEFLIPRDSPSQNEIAANHGPGRFAYGQVRDEFSILVLAEKMRQRIPRAAARRRVTFTRLYSGRHRRRDRGNLIGGLKPLLDVLVRLELLVDDSEKHVEDHYLQERHDCITGIRVRIEEFAR